MYDVFHFIQILKKIVSFLKYGLNDKRNRNGSLFAPFGMLELSVGIEFKPSIR